MCSLLYFVFVSTDESTKTVPVATEGIKNQSLEFEQLLFFSRISFSSSEVFLLFCSYSLDFYHILWISVLKVSSFLIIKWCTYGERYCSKIKVALIVNLLRSLLIEQPHFKLRNLTIFDNSVTTVTEIHMMATTASEEEAPLNRHVSISYHHTNSPSDSYYNTQDVKYLLA